MLRTCAFISIIKPESKLCIDATLLPYVVLRQNKTNYGIYQRTLYMTHFYVC